MLTPVNLAQFKEHSTLLTEYGPNQTMIDAALKGLTPAAFWVDQRMPQNGILLLNTFGYAFGWGDGLEAVLKENSTLRKKAILYIPHRGTDQIPFGMPLPRLEFSKHSGRQSISEILDRPPVGLHTVALTTANAHQSNWKEVILDISGTFENFQNSGGGIALTDGKVFAAEALVGFVGHRHTEIGTVTHPDFRGKGYSTFICAQLIDQLLTQGQQPLWSCRQDNIGSIKVAERIGFTGPTSYTAIVVEP